MSVRILPSVNLRDDITVPSRLEHYEPTSRSIAVVLAVLSNEANMVVAPYGSGKSMAAGVGALAVLNDPSAKAPLRVLGDKLAAVDPGLAKTIQARIKQNKRGRVVVLSGHVRDLPAALTAALELDVRGRGKGLEPVLDAIARLSGTDQVAIIWDEFGRHLESLVAEGRSRELDMIQRLAEWVSRAKEPTASLTLLLHQNLLVYATGLNQTTRNEWRKIEGRFKAIHFLEDSREIYNLVASVIDTRRGTPRVPLNHRSELPKKIISAQWFGGAEDESFVSELLAKAHPVSAGALQVLPRLVARVGQNERSLFTFIEGMDLATQIGMEEVYLAFSEPMRSDVGIGGVHRRWVEAESARSKAGNAIERETIAAAFLLQMGSYGERQRLPMAVLQTAVQSKGHSADATTAAIDALVKRKLLIYRKINDDVSVWHGVDIDIASKLRDERVRRVGDFNVLAFLDKNHPAPFIRPIRHNAELGTSRYLLGRYATLDDLMSPPSLPAHVAGHIVYVICNSGEEIKKARQLAGTGVLERTVVVVPHEPVPITDAALEIECLMALRKDESLLSEDPLVAQEIDELLAVARRQLAVVMHRLTTDRPMASNWYSEGRQLVVTAERPGSIEASALMSAWFPLTPRIVNDQLMRNTLSRQMQTARIRLITRLLEHSEEIDLGLKEDTSAEASIYKTVLARTELHIQSEGYGYFNTPPGIKEPGLKQAWTLIQDFFAVPGRRRLSELTEALSAPPCGTPAGVIPVIVMAGYRAFGRAVSFWSDGAYVGDFLGFDSTRMFLEPARHEVEVHTADKAVLDFLEEVSDTFDHRRPGRHDERISFAYDALRAWRSGIPEGALRSKRMTGTAIVFLRKLSEASSPAEFLITTLPELCAGDFATASGPKAAGLFLENIRNSIDGLVDGYLRDAVDVIEHVLRLEEGAPGTEGIRAWVECLDVDGLSRRDDLRATDKAILRTAHESLSGRHSPETFARVVSSILLQRGIEKWQDDTKEQLRKELRECRLRIEAAALDVSEPPAALAPMIQARISELQAQLLRIQGTTGGRKWA